MDRENNSAITLNINNINGQSNETIALKLHQQFVHPSTVKLICLLNNAGTPWCDNADLKKYMKNVTENCSTCQVYHKAPPRPIVGLPRASNFQETNAIDLKFCHGKILLHITDHRTRLSASTVVSNKKSRYNNN